MNTTQVADNSNVTEEQYIVIVDDEEMVLTSLRSMLELETDYHVSTFTSASEALEFAKRNRVDLVISDYLMPDMDGISLLSKMKEIDPQIVRIVLTGYADKENALKAINHVGVFQYIEKPWDADDLMIVLRNGLECGRIKKSIEGLIVASNHFAANLDLETLREFRKLY